MSKKIEIVPGLCQGYANCVVNAPDHFFLNDDGVVRLAQEHVSDGEGATVEGAVRSCPVAALRLVEND
jgi:ferredoxin